jgi:hypothetical protein
VSDLRQLAPKRLHTSNAQHLEKNKRIFNFRESKVYRIELPICLANQRYYKDLAFSRISFGFPLPYKNVGLTHLFP